jgi:hypothetical protein
MFTARLRMSPISMCEEVRKIAEVLSLSYEQLLSVKPLA